MESKWYICGLYDELHTVNGKEVAWGTQRFLGIEGPLRIYIYEDLPSEKSVCFDTKEKAENYIDKQGLKNGIGINVGIHFPVEVIEM